MYSYLDVVVVVFEVVVVVIVVIVVVVLLPACPQMPKIFSLGLGRSWGPFSRSQLPRICPTFLGIVIIHVIGDLVVSVDDGCDVVHVEIVIDYVSGNVAAAFSGSQFPNAVCFLASP